MMQKQIKSRMPQIGEATFCIAYLIFDLIAAIIFFVNTNGSQALYLFGVLTLVLGGGNAFHLVPRVIKAFRGNYPKVERSVCKYEYFGVKRKSPPKWKYQADGQCLLRGREERGTSAHRR